MATDFWVVLSRDGQRFSAHVESVDAGEARIAFDLNLADVRLREMFRALGRSRQISRGDQPPTFVTASAFGSELFDTVFRGTVRSIFDQARGFADARNETLRIRLKFVGVPELVDLPWELLRNESGSGYLALDRRMTLLRHLLVPMPIVPLKSSFPLRVLAVISTPKDETQLPSAEEEWVHLQNALAALSREHAVMLERSPDGTLASLRKTLRAHTPHVLHFIGHGDFGGGRGGQLLLQDQAGNAVPIATDQLANLLHDCDSLRLVVINACEGARTSRVDPFAGVAQGLISRGIPAVVAMQFPISDEAAAIFSASFYRSIANADAVDAAVAQARRELSSGGDELETEWATLVLYVRGDTQLFVSPPVVSPIRRALIGATIATIATVAVRGSQGPSKPQHAETEARSGLALTVFPWRTFDKGDGSQFKHQILAIGDTWFGIGGFPFWGTGSLLTEMKLRVSTVAANVTAGQLGDTLPLLLKQSQLKSALTGPLARRWDAIVLSVGLADLVGAIGSALELPANKRVLLKSDEVSSSADLLRKYVSDDGWSSLEKLIASSFGELFSIVSSGPSKGAPIVLHTYDYFTARDSPGGLGFGPWLYHAFSKFGIPMTEWISVTDGLVDRLASTLEATKQHPNVHLVPTRGVLIRASPTAVGVSGDWANELHPSRVGYRKLAAVYQAQLDILLG